MITLLIVTTIGVILYGYALTSRLDRFLQKGGFARQPETVTEREILLYGEQETVDAICFALDGAEISYDRTNKLETRDDATYRWVGAFSTDDENNLLACLLAKRTNRSIRMMAKCNDMVYKSVFKQTGVAVILEADITPDRILACLRG